jgi:hypothetical protein
VQTVKIVPDKITSNLNMLLPEAIDYGHKIKPVKYSERQFFPADYIAPLYYKYLSLSQMAGLPHNHQLIANALPKLYLLIYRIIFNIPDLYQLDAVVKGDSDFASVCCFNHPVKPFVGVTGLTRMQQILLEMERGNALFRESLHNLSDELNSKKITFEGLIPAVWVNKYRKYPSYDYEFQRILANNTGIDIIDEMTSNLSEDYRSDIRQEAALNCLRVGIDTLTQDEIANITRMVIRHSTNEYFRRKYTTKSLYSQPYPDSDAELWQTIADPKAENPQIIAERNEDELRLATISKYKTNVQILEPGDINCSHRISVDIDDNGDKVGICIHCGRKAYLGDSAS